MAARTQIRKRSRTAELIEKSRESALSAIQVFNNPLIQFKSETFIVLMVISWTYLLHAHYRSTNVEYRYFQQGPKRRKFDRTKRGSFKYWELEACLNSPNCPIDSVTATNLRFLIGLRHEIEHQMTTNLDDYLSSRYQACALNYNNYVKQLFGTKYGIDSHLSYSLQLVELSMAQVKNMRRPTVSQAEKAYIDEFDNKMADDDFNSQRFAYRLNFTRRSANHPGGADSVVEFVAPDSEDAKSVPPERWLLKDRERPKFLPSHVVRDIKAAGFPKFSINHHAKMWKAEEAKRPGKNYGVQVEHQWFWYELWIERVRQLCEQAGDSYR